MVIGCIKAKTVKVIFIVYAWIDWCLNKSSVGPLPFHQYDGQIYTIAEYLGGVLWNF